MPYRLVELVEPGDRVGAEQELAGPRLLGDARDGDLGPRDRPVRSRTVRRERVCARDLLERRKVDAGQHLPEQDGCLAAALPQGGRWDGAQVECAHGACAHPHHLERALATGGVTIRDERLLEFGNRIDEALQRGARTGGIGWRQRIARLARERGDRDRHQQEREPGR